MTKECKSKRINDNDLSISGRKWDLIYIKETKNNNRNLSEQCDKWPASYHWVTFNQSIRSLVLLWMLPDISFFFSLCHFGGKVPTAITSPVHTNHNTTLIIIHGAESDSFSRRFRYQHEDEEADAANNSPAGHICFYVWLFLSVDYKSEADGTWISTFVLFSRSLSSTSNQGLFPCAVCWRWLQQWERPTHILCRVPYPDCMHCTSMTRGLVLINTNTHSPGGQREKEPRLITPVKRGDRAPWMSSMNCKRPTAAFSTQRAFSKLVPSYLTLRVKRSVLPVNY